MPFQAHGGRLPFEKAGLWEFVLVSTLRQARNIVHYLFEVTDLQVWMTAV